LKNLLIITENKQKLKFASFHFKVKRYFQEPTAYISNTSDMPLGYFTCSKYLSQHQWADEHSFTIFIWASVYNSLVII